jgi:thiamine biosynthesis protein ThiC
MNQLEAARQGKITPEMEMTSRAERVPAQTILDGVRGSDCDTQEQQQRSERPAP